MSSFFNIGVETCLDEFGFPCQLNAAQRKRFKLRKFASENQWTTKFPTLDSALSSSTPSLLDLALTHGIHSPYRADIWLQAAFKARAAAGSSSHSTPTTTNDSHAYYTQLISVAMTTVPADVARQIELDLPRTFSEQKQFAEALAAKGAAFDGSRSSAAANAMAASDPANEAAFTLNEGDVHDAVRRMLRGFVIAHPEVGYLQSMNFLAGFFLLVFGRDREADAYTCFETLVVYILPGYYSPGMAALQADSDVASQLLKTRLPRLAIHLDRLGLADMTVLFLPRWLLCVYLNCFPADITVRVWDMVFLEAGNTSSSNSNENGRGASVLVETALAILRMCQTDILSCKSFADAVEVLKGLASRVTDAAELILLTRHPECTLRNDNLGELRAAYGGAGWASYVKEQKTAAAAAAVNSLPPTVTETKEEIESQTETVPSNVLLGFNSFVNYRGNNTVTSTMTTADNSNGKDADESCLLNLSELNTSISTTTLTRGANNNCGNQNMAPHTPSAAALSTSFSTTPMNLLTAKNAPSMGYFTPPPVSIEASLDRIFSPLPPSPLRSPAFRSPLGGGGGAAGSSANPFALRSPLGILPAAAAAAAGSTSSSSSSSMALQALRSPLSPVGGSFKSPNNNNASTFISPSDTLRKRATKAGAAKRASLVTVLVSPSGSASANVVPRSSPTPLSPRSRNSTNINSTAATPSFLKSPLAGGGTSGSNNNANKKSASPSVSSAMSNFMNQIGGAHATTNTRSSSSLYVDASSIASALNPTVAAASQRQRARDASAVSSTFVAAASSFASAAAMAMRSSFASLPSYQTTAEQAAAAAARIAKALVITQPHPTAYSEYDIDAADCELDDLSHGYSPKYTTAAVSRGAMKSANIDTDDLNNSSSNLLSSNDSHSTYAGDGGGNKYYDNSNNNENNNTENYVPRGKQQQGGGGSSSSSAAAAASSLMFSEKKKKATTSGATQGTPFLSPGNHHQQQKYTTSSSTTSSSNNNNNMAFGSPVGRKRIQANNTNRATPGGGGGFEATYGQELPSQAVQMMMLSPPRVGGLRV